LIRFEKDDEQLEKRGKREQREQTADGAISRHWGAVKADLRGSELLS